MAGGGPVPRSFIEAASYLTASYQVRIPLALLACFCQALNDFAAALVYFIPSDNSFAFFESIIFC